MQTRRAATELLPVLALDRAAARPLYRQIYDGFRGAILRGELLPGQRVASSRTLASELAISRIPALNAYAQLLAEGYFETRTGSGTFVCQRLPEHVAAAVAAPVEASAWSARRQLSRRSAQVPALDPLPWARGWGAFGLHQPALDAFPFALWSRLAARHSRSPRAQAMQTVDGLGLPRFREAICAYLRTSRAVRCDPDQILIVSGSQQALDIAVRVLLDPGDAVWMEEPGYWLARNLFRAAGCRLVPVPVDSEGLNIDAGLESSRGGLARPLARLAYVTPSHQFPLGVTMSLARRLQLLDWAQRHDAWILEDDYDGEYRFDTQPVASMQGLDAHARVIYIGTFSKVLFPALRLGYMVVPNDLVPRFAAVRNVMDIFPAYLNQELVCDFMVEGHFVRHLRRMRHLYRERRSAMVESLRQSCGERLTVPGAEAGMHLSAVFGSGTPPIDCDLAVRAAGERLWLWPLSPSYIGEHRRQGFIVGFGSCSSAAMPAAAQRLRVLIDSA